MCVILTSLFVVRPPFLIFIQMSTDASSTTDAGGGDGAKNITVEQPTKMDDTTGKNTADLAGEGKTNADAMIGGDEKSTEEAKQEAKKAKQEAKKAEAQEKAKQTEGKGQLNFAQSSSGAKSTMFKYPTAFMKNLAKEPPSEYISE